MKRRRFLLTSLALAVAAPRASEASKAEPVGVVTELHIKEGRIEIALRWGWLGGREALALTSTRRSAPSDRVGPLRHPLCRHLRGDGRHGQELAVHRRGPATIDVPGPGKIQATRRGGDGGRRPEALVRAGIVSSLQAMPGGKTYKDMAVRSVRAQPPIILAPRDTRVMPGAVVFDWAGPIG